MTDARDGLLRKLLQKIAIEQKYESPEIETAVVPSTGSNFTSQLFHATIKSEGKKDINAFAKVSVFGESMRQHTGNIFDIEPLFYGNIVKRYQEIEGKHEVPQEHRLVLPKFYGYSNDFLEEIMVLQDLSKEGFGTYDRQKSFDWAYASRVIEEMAKFHALSIAYQTEYPEEYQEVKKLFLKEIVDEKGPFVQFFEKSDAAALQIARPEHKERLQKFYDSYDWKKFIKFFMPKKRPVITHNDFKQSNLLYKVDENGELQVIILDYQTLYEGSGITDLLFFIFTGSDGAFREKYYDQLIEHYYESLAAALRRLGLDPEDAFPRRDFDEELKEVLPFGLLISCMTLPFITIDLDNIVKTKDGEYEYESVEDISGMMSRSSVLCHRRLNEIFDEYVKWGIL